MNFSKKLIDGLEMAFGFVGILLAVHLFQFVTQIDLGFLGIYPRHVYGLKGILTAPLVHGDWHHLFSNAMPLLILITTLFLFYRRVALRSFLMIYLLTGVTVWVLARNVFHIGASGIVYGLVCFIFWNGVFRKSLQAIALSLIIVFLYSGYFAGILPNQPGISWESHLLGALVGIFVAYYFKEEMELEEKDYIPSWEIEPEKEATAFLNKDVFEKTKAERLKEKEQQNFPNWYSSNTMEH